MPLAPCGGTRHERFHEIVIQDPNDRTQWHKYQSICVASSHLHCSPEEHMFADWLYDHGQAQSPELATTMVQDDFDQSPLREADIEGEVSSKQDALMSSPLPHVRDLVGLHRQEMASQEEDVFSEDADGSQEMDLDDDDTSSSDATDSGALNRQEMALDEGNASSEDADESQALLPSSPPAIYDSNLEMSKLQTALQAILKQTMGEVASKFEQQRGVALRLQKEKDVLEKQVIVLTDQIDTERQKVDNINTDINEEYGRGRDDTLLEVERVDAEALANEFNRGVDLGKRQRDTELATFLLGTNPALTGIIQTRVSQSAEATTPQVKQSEGPTPNVETALVAPPAVDESGGGRSEHASQVGFGSGPATQRTPSSGSPMSTTSTSDTPRRDEDYDGLPLVDPEMKFTKAEPLQDDTLIPTTPMCDQGARYQDGKNHGTQANSDPEVLVAGTPPLGSSRMVTSPVGRGLSTYNDSARSPQVDPTTKASKTVIARKCSQGSTSPKSTGQSLQEVMVNRQRQVSRSGAGDRPKNPSLMSASHVDSPSPVKKYGRKGSLQSAFLDPRREKDYSPLSDARRAEIASCNCKIVGLLHDRKCPAHVCTTCGGVGHNFSYCRNHNQKDWSRGRCHHCGMTGHMQMRCPQNNVTPKQGQVQGRRASTSNSGFNGFSLSPPKRPHVTTPGGRINPLEATPKSADINDNLKRQRSNSKPGPRTSREGDQKRVCSGPPRPYSYNHNDTWSHSYKSYKE